MNKAYAIGHREDVHATIRGFSLMETIVALAVASIIITSLMQVFVSGMGHIYAIRADSRLAGDAAHIVQTLSQAIRSAESVSVTDATHATVTRRDSTTFDILQNGSSMEVDGEPLTSGAVSVQSLAMSQVGTSLHMTFTLSAGQGTARTFAGMATFTPYE